MLKMWRRSSLEPPGDHFFYLRIDDRLIHGQVVVGWGHSLKIDRLILANDVVAGNASEKEFYLQIIPEALGGAVYSIAEAIAEVKKGACSNRRCVVVVASVEDAMRWLEAGVYPDALILGGIRAGGDRKRFLDYLFLSREEVEKLSDAARGGLKIICRDLPTSPAYDFLDLVKNDPG
jgi:mannose/fructose/N-acetylgalactosamine-specific phosphotransferase system component IIB